MAEHRPAARPEQAAAIGFPHPMTLAPHLSAQSISMSPLARGIGYRLAWVGGICAVLWAGVLWALS